MRSRLLVLAAVLAAASIVVAPASAKVPQGFVGTMIDGPFYYPDFDQAGEMNNMVSDGVESVRTVFNWAVMQPYKTYAQVPSSLRSQFQDIGGIPIRTSVTNQIVGLAASRRMTVLPVVQYTPGWDSRNRRNTGTPPSSPAAYARFVVALIHLYGPRGSFWTANPSIRKVPIRMWQIWNEPNFNVYWTKQPFESSYVKLLHAVHGPVKRADPGAKIVLAGLTNFSWRYLNTIYKIKGARKLFDLVAVHPYTATPRGVVTILQKVRAVMKAHGDSRKSLMATELSWPSAKGVARTLFENATTPQGQATKTGQAIRLLARYRTRLRLSAFYYYTWISNETLPGAKTYSFDFAGLLKFIDGQGPSAKPALRSFANAALSVEGCRRKLLVATNCQG